MVKVEFLGPINRQDMNLDVTNLVQLKEILNKDDELKNWLEKSAVAVNEKIIKDLNFELKDGDLIAILPPVCGG